MGYINQNAITAATEVVDEWKVFIGGAHGGQGHGKDVYPTVVLGTPFIGEPGQLSRPTWLGRFRMRAEAKNVQSYLCTRLFRFLVLLHKPAQHATRRVYAFVPIQDWTRPWTDADLYKKYGLTEDEIAFIETDDPPNGPCLSR